MFIRLMMVGNIARLFRFCTKWGGSIHSTALKSKLGWEPEITVQEMCTEMVAYDLKNARRTRLLREHGLDLPISIEG